MSDTTVKHGGVKPKKTLTLHLVTVVSRGDDETQSERLFVSFIYIPFSKP